MDYGYQYSRTLRYRRCVRQIKTYSYEYPTYSYEYPMYSLEYPMTYSLEYPMFQSPNTTRTVHVSRTNSYVNRIRPEQISTLEREFAKVKTLHNTDLELLAAEMGLDERDVHAWYADRLAAWKREQGLSDGFP